MRTPHNERLTPDIAETSAARSSEPAKSCPERRCVLTGDHGSRATLVRLAVSPDGLVLPDAHAKAPGRGAWIGVTRAELEVALGASKGGGKLKMALARSFKSGALDIPVDLPARIEDALRRALTDRLGLEMRSGTLILGTERIAESARNGAVALLLHASDASEGGRKRLDQAWRVGAEREGSGERGTILPLDRAALSVALGRDNVVHLGLGDSKAAERIDISLQRLLHFLGAEQGPAEAIDGGERAALRPDDDEI